MLRATCFSCSNKLQYKTKGERGRSIKAKSHDRKCHQQHEQRPKTRHHRNDGQQQHPKQPWTMATPWDLITEEAYRSWLLDTPIAADEYNRASLTDRRLLRTQYLAEQQEQRQRQPLHPNASMAEDIHALRKSMEAMALATAKGWTVHGSCKNSLRKHCIGRRLCPRR